jgi:hypothetical protein
MVPKRSKTWMPLGIACGLLAGWSQPSGNAQSLLAQELRTGRGDVRTAYDAPTQPTRKSTVRPASATQPDTRKRSAGQSPSPASRTPGKAAASQNSRNATQPATGTTRRHDHRQGVVQAGCPACEANNAASGIVHSEPLQESVIASGDVVYESDGQIVDPVYSEAPAYETPVSEAPVLIDLSIGGGGLINTFVWLTERMYFRTEGASFEATGMGTPVLLATGNPGSTTLFGNQVLHEDTQSGYRLAAGYWLDPCLERAIEIRAFDATEWETNFTAGSPQTVARPFNQLNPNQPNRLVVSEGAVTGTATVQASSQVWGGDILLRRKLFQAEGLRWDILLGYQGLRLEDRLTIQSNTNDTINTLQVKDHFATENSYDAGTIGLQRFSRWGNWSLDLQFKMGLGNMNRVVTIQGQRAINGTNESQGLLARNTNAGVYDDDTFVVSPEFGVALGYRLTRNFDLTFGYNYLSLTSLARASEQIDPSLQVDLNNPFQAVAPKYQLRESDYSLQAGTIGLQWRY